MSRLRMVRPIAGLNEAQVRRMVATERLFSSPVMTSQSTASGSTFNGQSIRWDICRAASGVPVREATVTVNLSLATGSVWAMHLETHVRPLSPTTVQRIGVMFGGSLKVQHYHRFAGQAVRLETAGSRGSYAMFAPGTKFTVGLTASGTYVAEPVSDSHHTPMDSGPTLDFMARHFGGATGLPAPAPASTPPAVPFVPGGPLTPPAPAPAPVIEEFEVAPAPVPVKPVLPAPVKPALPALPALPAMSDPLGLFRFPATASTANVVLDPQVSSNLDLLWKMHRSGSRQVLALVGPTGTGKTSLVYDLAARNGVGVFTFDAAGAREFGDWVGSTHLRDGKTEFLPSGFLQAIDADGPYAGKPRIVLIDEVNRAESSGSLNALIPVLHGFGSLYVPELGRSITVDPTVFVAMTANRGSAYAGTVSMDLALADRVTAWVRLNGLSVEVETRLVVDRTGVTLEQATALVTVARMVRSAAERGDVMDGGGVSTRRLLSAAEKVAAGFTMHAAACLSWLDSYSDEGGAQSEYSVVLAAIDGVLRGQ